VQWTALSSRVLPNFALMVSFLRVLPISGSIGPQSFLKLGTQFSYLISIAIHAPVIITLHIYEKLGTTP